VEVVAPIAEPGKSDILEDYIFPAVFDHGVPATINIAHLSLDYLPAIAMGDKKSLAFLRYLTDFSFSARERPLRRKAAMGTRIEVFRLNLKLTITNMVMNFTGLQALETGLFVISRHDDTINRMFLFVSALRFDGANGSIVLDAAVIPMTPALWDKPELREVLNTLPMRGLVEFKFYDAGIRLWREVLSVLAERCRTWSHGAGCEYGAEGRFPPPGIIIGGQTLCSCGQGKLPDNFIALPHWEEAARYATRVAISPIFALPFVEDVADEGLTPLHEKLPNFCLNCGRTNAMDGGQLNRCPRCLEGKYCSAVCQTTDWQRHRVECEIRRMH
jgi:uncharacterized protein (DUF983 family)